MRYLLNVAYLLLFVGYLPILALQRLFQGKRRPGLWKKFFGTCKVPEALKPRVLFHAVSLGEVNAIRGMVEEFERRHPDWQIVISTTTQTGFEAASKTYGERHPVCLFPFDFTWAVNRFLSQVKPEAVVLAELEIWPNMLFRCDKLSIPVIIANARLSERSFNRYGRLQFLLRKVFQKIRLVCAQNRETAQRFQQLGVLSDRCVVTGNLKYDNLLMDRGHPRINELAKLIQVEEGDLVWIAGSTQAPEEQIVIDSFHQLAPEFPHLRLLICPRHPERFSEVAQLLDKNGIPFTRRSRIKSEGDQTTQIIQRVTLLDSMGELKYWWGVGHLAFVGGSFGNRGGQNMLEPLAVGNAVCFGPNTRNFAHEVRELKLSESAVQLQSPDELTRFLRQCLTDTSFRDRLIANGKTYLREQAASSAPASKQSLDAISPLLAATRQNSPSRAA